MKPRNSAVYSREIKYYIYRQSFLNVSILRLSGYISFVLRSNSFSPPFPPCCHSGMQADPLLRYLCSLAYWHLHRRRWRRGTTASQVSVIPKAQKEKIPFISRKKKCKHMRSARADSYILDIQPLSSPSSDNPPSKKVKAGWINKEEWTQRGTRVGRGGGGELSGCTLRYEKRGEERGWMQKEIRRRGGETIIALVQRRERMLHFDSHIKAK